MAEILYASSTNSSPSRHITVLDVYDLASSIKLDLEQIVRNYGQQVVQDLACKVVSALETLEALAKNNERVNSEMAELKSSIDKLESERISRNKDKERFEKEMVEFEDTLKKENDDLWDMIESLQGEKKQLQDRVSSLAEQSVEEKEREVVRDEEFQAMLSLKKANTEQKEQIKDLKSSLRTTEKEAEDLRGHIEKLFAQNYELVRKNKSLQKQCKVLVRERVDLMEKVETMEEKTLHLKQTLQETSRACRDLENQTRRPEDPNSPRFSINELREVLQEKTSLKQLVIQLRDELDALNVNRPNSELDATDSTCDTSESIIPRPSSTVTTSACESESGNDSVADENNRTTDDEIVYGPINKEPEEKLYPWRYQRRTSGIRRMFNIFFATNSPR